ncbi:hypothetical protein BDF14DRAFT_1853206 [Spinellus fusiger]|nr:hypothetical protein BDF14DRAFT_1853206 [Spinellus fusiger]
MSQQWSESFRRTLHHSRILQKTANVYPSHKALILTWAATKKTSFSTVSSELRHPTWLVQCSLENGLPLCLITPRYYSIVTSIPAPTHDMPKQSTNLTPTTATVNDTLEKFGSHLKHCKELMRVPTSLSASEMTLLWEFYNILLVHKQSVLNPSHYETFMLLLEHEARKARRSTRWGSITQLYEDSQRLSIIPNTSMSLIAITAYGKVHQLSQAESIFRRLLKETPKNEIYHKEIYRRYIDACWNCNTIHTALEVLRDMRKNSIDRPTASKCVANTIHLALQKNNVELAMKTAGIFPVRQLAADTDTLTLIAESLWKGYVDFMVGSSGINVSKELLEYKDFRLEVFITEFARHMPRYESAALRRHPSAHQNHYAQDLFTTKHLRLLTNVLLQANPLFVPSLKVYNMLLEMYAVNENSDAIKKVKEHMQLKKVYSNSDTTSILLRTLKDSLSLQQIQTMHQSLAETCMLDEPLYKSLIYLYTHANHVQQAQDIVTVMEQKSMVPSTHCHLNIVECYVRQGQIPEAHTWLESSKYLQKLSQPQFTKDCNHSEDEGVALDPIAAVMEGWVSLGNADQCIALYNSLTASSLKQMAHTNRRVFKAIVTARCLLSDWRACELHISKRKHNITPTTLSRMINTLMEATREGMPALSGATLVRSLQSMEAAAGLQVHENTLSTLIKTLGDRGEHEDAYTLYMWVRGKTGIGKGVRLVEYTKRCRKPILYLSMIQAAIKNNDMRKAERASVDLMYRARMQMSGTGEKAEKKPRSVLEYNMLLNAYASQLPLCNLTGAKRTFQEMLSAGVDPDIVTYNTLIKAFVAADNMDAAYQIFNNMLITNTKPDHWTVNTIVHGLVSRKEWTSIHKFVKGVKSTGLLFSIDNVTFNLIVQGFLCLDSTVLKQIHALKANNLWPKAKKLEKEYLSMYTLTPSVIWDIFETSIGLTREAVEAELKSPLKSKETKIPLELPNSFAMDTSLHENICQHIQIWHEKGQTSVSQDSLSEGQDMIVTSRTNAFVSLFTKSNDTEYYFKPDKATYKLFMKAFECAGDSDSASSIYAWMMRKI